MRKILGILIGIAIGFLITILLESIAHLLFPLAPGTDPGSPDLFDHVPVPAKIMVLLAWFFGAAAGCYMGQRIGGWLWSGWITVATLLIAGLSATFMIPHPLWMQICAVAVPILGGLIADRLPGGSVRRSA